jgi:hypothetical protein
LAVPLPGVYSTYGRPPEIGFEKFMILLLQSKGEGREKANARLPALADPGKLELFEGAFFDAESRRRGEEKAGNKVKT